MKIAFKIPGHLNLALLAMGLLLSLNVMKPSVALAVDAALAPPLNAPALSAPPAVSAAPIAPSAATPKAIPTPTTETAALPASESIPLPPPPATTEKPSQGIANAEEKISDSVKAVSKHLTTTDSLTLDDLNSARQIVAKIDALIEVEKRFKELEKLRSDREGGGRSFAGPIPASMLNNAMPIMPPQPMMPVSNPSSDMNAQSSYMPELEVSRIFGSSGHYSAIIKTLDGQTKRVRVGDQVTGVGKILAITTAGVELERGKTKRVIQVKNVGTVFGNSP